MVSFACALQLGAAASAMSPPIRDGLPTASAPSPSAGTTQISWLSHPVRANDTVLVSGSGFAANCSARLRSADGSGQSVSLVAHCSADAASFVLPAATGHQPFPQWSVSIDGSNELVTNEPEVWWWQGDLGKDASVGGSVRVMGRSISLPPDEASEARDETDAEVAQLHAAISAGDARAAQALAGRMARRNEARASAGRSMSLQLRRAGGGGASWGAPIPAQRSSATAYHAMFPLPATVTAGAYEAQLLGPSGHAVPLVMFSTVDAPRDTTLNVRSPASGGAVIDVGAYCRVGVDCGVVGVNSSFALEAALRAAAAKGGGTVTIPRGQWYLNGTDGVVVPPNTMLRGEGMALTALYMPEQQKGEAPGPAYLRMGSPAAGPTAGAGWGLEDLAVYITHYYQGVVYCGAGEDGFSMRRVRVRANSFAMLGVPIGNPSRGRSANYTQLEVGAAVRLAGCVNYVVEDCDLYSTWARPAPNPFSVPVSAARALNATGSTTVALSLRHGGALREDCQPQQEERG